MAEERKYNLLDVISTYKYYKPYCPKCKKRLKYIELYPNSLDLMCNNCSDLDIFIVAPNEAIWKLNGRVITYKSILQNIFGLNNSNLYSWLCDICHRSEFDFASSGHGVQFCRICEWHECSVCRKFLHAEEGNNWHTSQKL